MPAGLLDQHELGHSLRAPGKAGAVSGPAAQDEHLRVQIRYAVYVHAAVQQFLQVSRTRQPTRDGVITGIHHEAAATRERQPTARSRAKVGNRFCACLLAPLAASVISRQMTSPIISIL